MSQQPIDLAASLAGPLATTAVAAVVLAEIVRRLAWRFGVVDVPGGRRLHARPTPRGGGLAVALAWAVGSVAMHATGPTAAENAPMLAVLGFAGLGLADDIRPLPAWSRLAAQVAIVCVAAAFGMPDDPSWSAASLVVVALVGLFVINAFNFVDGADGLVPLQVLAITGGLLILVRPESAASPWLHAWQVRQWLLAAALLGFLPFNVPKARLFLGDVGSLMLGSACVAAALEPVLRGALHPAAALALFSVICVDPAWTLLRRTLRRAPILQAHLEHGYHRWLRAGVSHLRISLGAAAVNALLAVPAAWAIQRGVLDPALGLGLVVLPILVVAIRAGAGAPAQ
ncbi:MAG: hypothetical protein H6747_04035 [Deltaproteobacteria bacterium]|nr:hypothetical protein [Deltaproteobacteria bacterium]